jgi:hypothetical protein
MRSDSELPMPWPEFMLVRSRMGWPDVLAACIAAVNLRECIGLTRPSVAPVSINTAG